MAGDENISDGVKEPLEHDAQRAEDREVFDALQRGEQAPTNTAPDDTKSTADQTTAVEESSPEATVHPDESTDTSKDTSSDGWERRAEDEAAREALRRDGLNDAEVGRLLEGMSDERVAELSQNRRDLQSGRDRLGNENVELQKQIDALKVEKGPPENPIEKLAKHFEDLGQTETAEIIKETLSGLVTQDSTGQRDTTDPNANGSQTPTLSGAGIAAEFQEPIDRLVTDYPALKEQGNRSKLGEVVLALADKGALIKKPSEPNDRYVDRMVSTAARVLYPDQADRADQRRLLDKNHAERNGQPESAASSSSAPASLSDKEREHVVFLKLAGGATHDEARRASLSAAS